MKLIEINKVFPGKFVTRYDLKYLTEDNNTKNYEMLSRNSNISTQEDLYSKKADAVVLILHNEDQSKILLNYEYRMAVGKPVYNFPAGLIDAGETVEVAAKRELFEETGLNLVKVNSVWPESFSAVGLSNEKSICILGIANGEFKPSTSDVEEITAQWKTKAEVNELLKTEAFAARTQCYCRLWADS